MKLKKIISTTLALGLLVSSLTGCASTNNAEEKSSDGKVVVEFWNALTGENEKIMKSYVDKFNSQSDTVEVKMISQGDYWENGTKLQAGLAAGNQPDITMLEVTQVAQFSSVGALADMKNIISDEKQSDFLEGLMREAEYDGKTVGVPLNRSTPLMYVNAEMCEKAGLDPTGPKNWEELKMYAQKLTNKDDGVVGLAVPIDIWFFEALLYQQGSTVLDDNNKVDFNNEKGVNALTLWQDMMKEGTMQLPPGEGYDAWDAAKDAFVNGKAAMTFQSTASLAGLLEQTEGKFTIATGFLPEESQYAVPTGGANVVVMEKSTEDEKKAAGEFIEFMTDKENTVNFSIDTGYIPTTKSSLESEEIKSLYKEKPQYEVAVKQLEYSAKRPGVVGYVEATEKLMDEIKKALMDLNLDPTATIKSATDIMQGIIDKNNK
ncbi:ABC transporter substrate-binding protein [Romboutsia weinsteinii]|uniref:ABC transporter substrate-binding protein n=1 Tax=Romboutsia weinsteinii TaxID=2020949 RepID=A0A371J432_9FIRM|nr:ABC transporter substrate-binding protein [Romboutsia weinsteinii]RDY27473.1 ABC transporter substrate-binding protein [Romboutsia weinsteinii]